jgi:lipid-binding SYLF domain-containing protein
MKTTLRFAPLLLAALLSACAVNPSENQKEATRKDIAEMSASTLQRLYRDFPGSKRHVEGAYGHAIFSNYGVSAFWLGGAGGQGAAVRRESGERVFMKMAEVQAGMGFGARKFQIVWVFETQAAFDQFVNSGWELGAQATAAAASKGEGAAVEGALSVSRGVWLYQMTETGVALELMAKGTKYFKDADLNR